jgi:hypothetical protein
MRYAATNLLSGELHIGKSLLYVTNVEGEWFRYVSAIMTTYKKRRIDNYR